MEDNPIVILGAGATLHEMVDYRFNIPTIALNSAAHFPQKPTYYMAIDGALTLKYHLVRDGERDNRVAFEYDYFMKMLTDEQIRKVLAGGLRGAIKQRIPGDFKNIEYHRIKKKKPFLKDCNYILGGGGVTFSCMHWIYKMGFNPVILCGVDFCKLVFNRNVWVKYFWELIPGIDNPRQVDKNKYSDIHPRLSDAPNGEEVQSSARMESFGNCTMNAIRHMKKDGIKFYKTSERGMIDVPYITREKLNCLNTKKD